MARTTFSSPMIKAAGLARGTSRTISRLRGAPTDTRIGTVDVRAIEGAEGLDVDATNPSRWRKRA
ncbi:MAG TPA: hypothetical protein VLN74_16840 [Ilumatobacteraceae bacterium]|nr:hypothetical protein [Ilumatobacteraceae bacterium]